MHARACGASCVRSTYATLVGYDRVVRSGSFHIELLLNGSTVACSLSGVTYHEHTMSAVAVRR